MERNARIIFIVFVGWGLLQLGDIQGKWIAFTAPRLNARTLETSSFSFERQRDLLIRYKYRVCEAFAPCPAATMKGPDAQGIAEICLQSAEDLEALTEPEGLPPAVVKNLEIYRSSLAHSSRKTAKQWGSAKNDGGAQASSWEVDTCGYNSIPQKVLRFYELDRIAGKKIVTCDDIQTLYANLPAL